MLPGKTLPSFKIFSCNDIMTNHSQKATKRYISNTKSISHALSKVNKFMVSKALSDNEKNC